MQMLCKRSTGGEVSLLPQKNLPKDDETGFCMVKSDGMWSLKRSHAYYYQVQLQQHVCPDALMQILLCGHKRKLQLNVFIEMTGS